MDFCSYFFFAVKIVNLILCILVKIYLYEK